MEKIKNLFNLKKINVSFNSLDEIHPVTFVGLINLEKKYHDITTKYLENWCIFNQHLTVLLIS